MELRPGERERVRVGEPPGNDRAFYESLWSQFSSPLALQLAIHTESRRPLLRLLADAIPAEGPARILEVGCGTALDSCLLAAGRDQVQAFACDISDQAVRVARRNAQEFGARLHTFVADLTSLPFPDDFYDMVFSQGVLEHFADPALAMREQVRVLRPGGALVVDVPQKYNVYTLRKHQAMRENRWPWGWETEYSLAELRAWAPRYGLEVRGAVGYQHGRVVDRLLVHPHRALYRRLAKWRGTNGMNGYQPGTLAQHWEGLWDAIDTRLGPYFAINVAVAFRKSASAEAQ
jgi:SAM-dependent methyltransferase